MSPKNNCPNCAANCVTRTGVDGPVQIVCWNCGMRGPYRTGEKTAEQLWQDIPRVKVNVTFAEDLEDTRANIDAAVSKRLTQAALNTLDAARAKIERLEAEVATQTSLIEKLETVLISTAASLAAATSLLKQGPKSAAPSNKMFDQMVLDYEASLEEARAALEEAKA